MNRKKADAAEQEKVVSWSLIYHISMTLIKAVVGLVTGSKVLVAEAVHSFSDCFAFGINYHGARDKRLSLATQSILIGAIMFLSGVWICADNIAIIVSRIPARPGLFALLVAKISILANGYLYYISSKALERDPKNSNLFMFMIQNKTNLFAACFGFLGIFLAVMGLVYCDPIGAIVIGGFQIQGAMQIFKEYFEKERAKVSLETKQRVAFSLAALAVAIMFVFTRGVEDTLARRNMILIPAETGMWDGPVSTLLGRAPYFCLLDLKKKTTSIRANNSRMYNVEESIILGSIVRESRIGVVLAGKVGPHMFSELRGQGVRIYYFDTLQTVGSTFADYQAGRLKMASSANAATGFGRSRIQWLRPW
ncbi:MAG: cation transporter [Candidatus Omnitrophota bacterium]